MVLARGLDRPTHMDPRPSGDSISDDGSTHPVLIRHGGLRLTMGDACANGDDGIVAERRPGVELSTPVPGAPSAAILSVSGVRLMGPRVQVAGSDAPRDIAGVAADLGDLSRGEVQGCSVRRHSGPALTEWAVPPLEPPVSARCTRTRPGPARGLVVDYVHLGPESFLGGVKVSEEPKGRFINHSLDRTQFGIDLHGNQSEV